MKRTEEGLFILIGLRLSAGVGIVGFIAYLINPAWMAWAAIRIPDAVRWFGLALAVVTEPLLYWVMSTLGANLTDTVVTRRESFLVTSGPYRFVRHPFYFVFFTFYLSFMLFSGNLFVGEVGLLAATFIVIRTSKEEAKLIERFGDGYRRYMERTGRFFPRLG